MKQDSTALLFGGALLASGMPAHAQEMIFHDSSLDGYQPSFTRHVLEAYASDGYGGYSTQFSDVLIDEFAPDDLNLETTRTSRYGVNTTRTIRTSELIRTEAEWEGGGIYDQGRGSAGIYQHFSVTEDTNLVVTWDLTGLTIDYASMILFEEVSNDVLMEFPEFDDNVSNTLVIPLTAGTRYVFAGGLFVRAGSYDTLEGGIGQFDALGVPQFIQARIVPAPPAGLLGLGASCWILRRRRST